MPDTPTPFPASNLMLSRDIVEGAPDGILLVDDDGVIRLTNRQLGEMVGRPHDELVGCGLEALLPEGIHSMHRANFRRYLEAPAVRGMGDPRGKVAMRRADGSLLPVEIALSPLGETHLTMAIVRDISDRLRVETEHETIRRSLDTIDHGLLLLRPETLEIVYANTGAVRHTRYRREDLVGLRFTALCGDAQDPAVGGDLGDDLRADLRALAAGRVASLTRYISLHRSDGTSFPAEVTFSHPTTPSGVEPQIAALVRNVSERVAVERERDRRERLLSALAAIRREALSEAPAEDVLHHVAEAAADQLDAQVSIVVVAASGSLWCRAAAADSASLTGARLPAGSLLDEVIGGARPVQGSAVELGLDELDELPPMAHVLAVPLVSSDSCEGALLIGRAPGAAPFPLQSTAIATTLAAEAAVSLVLDRVRDERRYLSIVEDRERIARDLHDLVIQRLFATGMALQASLGSPDRLAEKATEAVADLDETIAIIRQSIFQLTQTDHSLLGAVERLVDQRRATGRNSITLEVTGDLDHLPEPVATHLVPVLNELLSNVERHANAQSAVVRVDIGDEWLLVSVEDDGEGPDHEPVGGFGLRNLAARAELLGGRLTTSWAETGSAVDWQVPLLQADDRDRPVAQAESTSEEGP